MNVKCEDVRWLTEEGDWRNCFSDTFTRFTSKLHNVILASVTNWSPWKRKNKRDL